MYFRPRESNLDKGGFFLAEKTDQRVRADHNVVEVDFCDKEFIRQAIKQNVWPLTPMHWEVIRFVRDYHRDTGQPAIAVRIGRATGLSCRQLHELFPLGAIRTIFPLLQIPLPHDLSIW